MWLSLAGHAFVVWPASLLPDQALALLHCHDRRHLYRLNGLMGAVEEHMVYDTELLAVIKKVGRAAVRH